MWLYYNGALGTQIAPTGNSYITGNLGVGDTTPDGDIDIGSSYANSGDAHWTQESHSKFKENIEEIEPVDNILDKWLDVSLYKWNYKESHIIESQGYDGSTNETKLLSGIVHAGMMADEFNPLFTEHEKDTLSGDEVQNAIIMAIQELVRENQFLKSELCKKDLSYSFC